MDAYTERETGKIVDVKMGSQKRFILGRTKPDSYTTEFCLKTNIRHKYLKISKHLNINIKDNCEN